MDTFSEDQSAPSVEMSSAEASIQSSVFQDVTGPFELRSEFFKSPTLTPSALSTGDINAKDITSASPVSRIFPGFQETPFVTQRKRNPPLKPLPLDLSLYLTPSAGQENIASAASSSATEHGLVNESLSKSRSTVFGESSDSDSDEDYTRECTEEDFATQSDDSDNDMFKSQIPDPPPPLPPFDKEKYYAKLRALERSAVTSTPVTQPIPLAYQSPLGTEEKENTPAPRRRIRVITNFDTSI